MYRFALKSFAALFGLSVLAINVVAGSTALPARADQPRLRWRDGLIRIAVSETLLGDSTSLRYGTDAATALRRSIARWEEVAAVRFVVEESSAASVSPAGLAGDGVSLITAAATAENVLFFSKDPLTESARTRVFYNRSGFITEGDIVLNPYQLFSTDGTPGTFDLEAVLTHELGHLLGLGHSSVLGSVMASGRLKNSTGETSVTELTAADAASVRDLYGFEDDIEECCGVISGRLTAQPDATGLDVWAEDNVSGRVAAQTEVRSDGTFRLGGLHDGTYVVLWRQRRANGETAVGELGTHRVRNGVGKTVNARIDRDGGPRALHYIGLDTRMADSAVLIESGREYTLYLAGNGLDADDINIEFNSPHFFARPGTIRRVDAGNGVSAISFELNVESGAPRGVYSLYLTSNGGIVAAMIGGLSVRSPQALR